ncbi:MAG: SDR family NAD(P)-dependent oxidoreductase [Actinomycetes bacterium]|jgi:NAD(P)-dependent dehydrogenase (short-subunit alcohol dehydrogenase family)
MTTQYAIPAGWDVTDIPDLAGKRFLITGGTSGLGRASAMELARHGADVTITARSAQKGERAISEIGRASFLQLDLTDLASVRTAAATITESFDVVILNAGVMATPLKSTKDGFELQMGTNHLGHFAFAGLIKNFIKERLVVMTSQAHRMGGFESGSLEDIRERCVGAGSYSPWAAYGASKLANLLFVAHLERLRIVNGWSFIPLAAHPGYANTNLQSVGPAMRGNLLQERFVNIGNRIVAQSAESGARPGLCAATFPGLLGASYLGPDGFMEMRGHPKLTRGRAIAYDQTLAANLWQVSEELTGVKWEDAPHA